MLHKTLRLAMGIGMFWFGLGAGTQTKANLTVQTPFGLVAGDTFRIAFLTDDKTYATSTDINYYNTFVNNDAISDAGGGSNVITYGGTPLTFAAIASTPTISATTNIGVTGAPVYSAIGTLIASSDTTAPGGLWSGSLYGDINLNFSVGFISPVFVWTGTEANGTSPYPLGSSSPEFGDNGWNTEQWTADFLYGGGGDAAFAMYGISQVLTVPGAVPEPTSVVMALIGISAAIAYSAIRCRKIPSAQPC